MLQRLTYCFVKSEFEKAGYTLLDDVYKNARTQLKVLCTSGHRIKITYSSFKAGRRCKFCRKNAPVYYNEVKQYFQNFGYTLLSKTYEKASTKLEYICPKGTHGFMTWNNFRAGHRCSCCVGREIVTLDKIRYLFLKEGYKLLSNLYINSRTKIDYVCNNGHLGSITWDAWKAGHRCAECAYINKFGSGNPAWKGGISYDPYCQIWTDKDYKESIKQRDDYKCLNPCCNKKDKRLHIHHIDYDKKNCGPNNLITLCGSCNARANKDRKWHTAWYQAIIKNRGHIKFKW